MASYNEIILDLPDYSIAALTWGPKDGKPLLAIHGWLDNAASFIPLIPYLQDYYVIAVDLAGHGHSPHFAQSAYFHLIDYIADIQKIVNYLDWQEYALLGHSLGAGICAVVAGTTPERITALGLIDGIGVVTQPAANLPDLVRASIQDYLKLPSKKPKYYSDIDAAIEARLRATKMHRDAVELIVARGIKQTEQGLTWRTDPRLVVAPLVLPTEEQLMAFLERITAPTCLIRAQAGYPFDEVVMDKRIKAVKNIIIESVPGEHHVHMDHPNVVGPILQAFFAKHIK